MYDDTNVCFMHACLLGGRCLGRRCKVLKHPGYTFRRLCLPESEKKKKKKKKKILHFCNVLCTVSNISIQLSFCLAHLLNFIYLLMWHFCYTEHVSFIYIYIDYVFFVFLKTIPLYNIYPVLYDYYYYFGGCRASGYV